MIQSAEVPVRKSKLSEPLSDCSGRVVLKGQRLAWAWPREQGASRISAGGGGGTRHFRPSPTAPSSVQQSRAPPHLPHHPHHPHPRAQRSCARLAAVVPLSPPVGLHHVPVLWSRVQSWLWPVLWFVVSTAVRGGAERAANRL
ncbi:hypothetical protein SRHO_G00219200 [Serrasalmus rhombeus]